MENNEELVRLEQLVDNLIGKYSDLKGQFHALEKKLRTSEEEREFLKLEVAELHEQRSEVGRRVNGLLGRLELWESEHGVSSYTVEDETEEENTFSDTAEQENG